MVQKSGDHYLGCLKKDSVVNHGISTTFSLNWFTGFLNHQGCMTPQLTLTVTTPDILIQLGEKYVHSRRVSVSLPQGFPTQKNYQRHVPWSRVVEVILQPVYLIHLIHQHPSHVLNGWGWDEWMGWLLWVGWNLRIFTLWMRSISRNKKRIQVELVDWYLFTTAWLYLIGIN